jgi:hypothetical protein
MSDGAETQSSYHVRMPSTRAQLPQVAILPGELSFTITVNGEAVRSCEDELDAHHWAKHAVECVNRGMRNPAVIRHQLDDVCRVATHYNLHS